MKSAVLVFPGSNCDRDLAVAIEQVTGRAPAMVWHRDSELPEGTGLIAIPGGFSYGDYLRTGAVWCCRFGDRDHPFTAPAVSPAMIWRSASR